MKNLVAFIKNIRFFLLFLLLQIIAFVLIYNGSSYQSNSMVTSANNVTGWAYGHQKDVKNYLSLKEQNQELQQRVKELENKQISNFQRLGGMDILVDDTIYQQQYSYVAGTIVKSTTNPIKNILVINVGSKQGIKREMGVVSPKGVIGLIKDVSTNYSTIMPLMHQNLRIRAKSPTQNLYGELQWLPHNSINEVTVNKVPTYIDLVEGDTMVTTTEETAFPMGKPIGTVKNITNTPGSNYKTIILNTCVDFGNLNHAYVIKNAFKLELDSLNMN